MLPGGEQSSGSWLGSLWPQFVRVGVEWGGKTHKGCLMWPLERSGVQDKAGVKRDQSICQARDRQMASSPPSTWLS